MNRTIGGLPLVYWIGALGVGVIGFLWFKKRGAAASQSPASKATLGGSAPAFSQQQEVQDFQIFSALTSAQQASDLNFLGQVGSLFSGGSSTGTSTVPGGGGGSTQTPPTTTPPPTAPAPPPTVPAPPSTGTAPPATQAQTPGYGLVQTAQGEMVWLGVNSAGQPIYNVGGGAPVYFGNASALATGAQYEQPGEDIYTPVGYEGLVAHNTATLGQPYVG